MKYTSLLFAVCFCVNINAQIYRSVDDEGNPVFSDVPTDGAEEVELRKPTSVESLVTDPASVLDNPVNKKAPPFRYNSIVITSPSNDQSIRDNGGNITITAAIDPGLRYDDVAVLYLDGKEHLSGKAATFNLENLDRGTHTARVSVRDQTGKLVDSSRTVTFHLLRQSIQRTPTSPPPPPSN